MTIVSLFDDTYEYLLAGENFNEDFWWTNTRLIRSIFEDYLDPTRATITHISFGSYPHLRDTLVWGVIFYHIYEDNILSKIIKYHPILVFDYDQ